MASSSRVKNPLKHYHATKDLDCASLKKLEAEYSRPALVGTLVLAEIQLATKASSSTPDDSTRSAQHKINALGGALEILIETNMFGEQSAKTRNSIKEIGAAAVASHKSQHGRKAALAGHEPRKHLLEKAVELFFTEHEKKPHPSVEEGVRRILPLLESQEQELLNKVVHSSDKAKSIYRSLLAHDRIRHDFLGEE